MERIDRAEAAVAGAAAAFVVVVVIATRFLAEAKDVLGFVGSAFGASAAVMGTLYLERWKQRAAIKKVQDHHANALVAVAHTSANIVRHDDAVHIRAVLKTCVQPIRMLERLALSMRLNRGTHRCDG